jgi:quinohemoprotein amine dehydrogenase
MLKRYSWLLTAAFACALLVRANAAQETKESKEPKEKVEGIPIQSDLVVAKCGSCHKPDDQKRMSRISWRRASPENWERTVKRMVSLNHASLEAADARAIVKYLSDHNGLAPEEVRPIAFEAERRTIDFSPDMEKDVADTCSSCHSLGRVFSERRTKEEWELLVAMHRGYYPLVDMQPMNSGPGFRRARPPQAAEAASDGPPPDTRQPMDKAIAYLAKTYPLNTPEWSSWSAAVEPVSLAGRWGLSGYALGKGPVVGQVVVTADPSAPDNFITEIHYTFTRSGQTVSRKGKSVVYTGFQWRGRSSEAGPGPAPTASAGGGGGGSAAAAAAAPTAPDAGVWRESLFVERTRKEMWGRWFTGAYDELGIDVKLTRLGSEPAVFGSNVAALKTSGSAHPIKIYGANLPASLKPTDISLGRGVKVSRIVSATPDLVTVEVDVAADAPLGPRDLSVAGAVYPSALVVFDKVDGIKVAPQSGMARVGGAVFPKGYEQFEAIAFSNGPDGKPNTKDDWPLGIVDVKWSIEEYTATFSDDDLQYVGTMDASTGLFTPNLDGPNPKRSGNRNNIGDVWAVAVLAPDAALGTTKPLRARGHLLVTVPVYMTWFAQ